jgi:hypothetical protein
VHSGDDLNGRDSTERTSTQIPSCGLTLFFALKTSESLSVRKPYDGYSELHWSDNRGVSKSRTRNHEWRTDERWQGQEIHLKIKKAALDSLGNVGPSTPHLAKFHLPFSLETANRYGEVGIKYFRLTPLG